MGGALPAGGKPPSQPCVSVAEAHSGLLGHLALQSCCRAQEFLVRPELGVWGTAACPGRKTGVISVSR